MTTKKGILNFFFLHFELITFHIKNKVIYIHFSYYNIVPDS